MTRIYKKISAGKIFKILERFNIGVVVKAERIKTSGNIAYLVTAEKGRYFLRLCPAEGLRWRSKNEIAAEIELLKYVKKRGVPVILPIADKSGHEIISIGRCNGYMRPFIDAAEKLSPTIAETRAAGRILGGFHKKIKGYKTKNARKHIFDVSAARRYLRAHKKEILKSNFKNVVEFVGLIGKELSALNFPKILPTGMIHEDFGKRHVLWRGGKIAAVVDFDRSYYGSLLFDLGQALRGWCFVDDWKKWSVRHFRAFIDGYQSERKVTKIEKKYLIDVIRFGILERALAFCSRFVYSGQKKADEAYAWKSATTLLSQISRVEF